MLYYITERCKDSKENPYRDGQAAPYIPKAFSERGDIKHE